MTICFCLKHYALVGAGGNFCRPRIDKLHCGTGLTETCGPATLGFPDEMCMLGTVGTTAVYNELRLEEVPEMGYNPLGEPPCGEICVRGKSVFSEYHKNPELTRESVKDGWFHTGLRSVISCIY
jgi:long-subunit acyl-CoA synthetase (AMP-forming)